MSDVLELADVGVTAGDLKILDGVTLAVPSGQILAVVGPNGAGKTTLLDAISGIAEGCTGTVSIEGNGQGVLPGKPRAGVGRVFQGSPLPETLTVGELAALVTGSHERAAKLLESFGLAPHAQSFIAELSTGMRRIIDLAVSTVGTPKVLLLDEPSSGLAQSEIEHLADIIKRWRDLTGAAVIIVEHDAWLVNEVADLVIVMDGGTIVTKDVPKKALKTVRAHVKSATDKRIRTTADPRFKESLDKVNSTMAPRVPISRTISSWTIARLGLRDMSAGMGSVLLLGVLSRVLKVELGVSLGVTAAVLASYNLAAPFALAVGHRSDRYPIFGRRRTPYIIGGGLIAGMGMIAAPHVLGQLAKGVTLPVILESVALLVAMGFGMWGGGTVFLALLADIVPEKERPHAISINYIMLMFGVITGITLTASIVKSDASNLGVLFAVAGILIAALPAIAVWGKEPPEDQAHAAREHVPFRIAFRAIASIRQARLFFVFSSAAVLFLFLQQGVLQPFGGDVLDLDVRTTSTFSGLMFVGTLIGMWWAGRPFAARYDTKQLARAGIYAGFIAFGALALAAATKSAAPSWLSIVFVGLASGVFTVAGLSLMMAMIDRRHTALFMGIWTIGRSIADASATLGGGLIFEAGRRVVHSVPGGYAIVFAVEAVGLALLLPLLKKIDPAKFREEAAQQL